MSSSAENLCSCGRSFINLGALRYHQHSCGKTKKRLAEALVKAKEVWAARKRRRVTIEDLVMDDLPAVVGGAEVPGAWQVRWGFTGFS
jgi:hypothetical protein